MIIATIGDAEWLITVVIAGYLINILAKYTPLERPIAKFSGWWRTRSRRIEKQFEASVGRCLDHREIEEMFKIEAAVMVFSWLFSSALFILLLEILVWSQPTGFLKVVLSLLMIVFGTISLRSADKAANRFTVLLEVNKRRVEAVK